MQWKEQIISQQCHYITLVQLEVRKKDEQLQSKKKVLAFHTSSDMDNSDDDEEEMAMLSRKFRKFLK